MKRFIKQLWAFYAHRAGTWVAAALLSAAVLPYHIRAVVMLITGRSLSIAAVIAADAVGWLAAWLFFILASRALPGHPGGGTWREMGAVWYRGGIWLLATAGLSGALYKLLMVSGARLAISAAGWLYLLLMALGAVILSGALATVLFWLLCVQAAPAHDTPFRTAARYWFRKPLLVLAATATVAIGLFLMPLVHEGIVAIWPGLALSYLSRMASSVLAVVTQWVVVTPLVCFLFQQALRQRGAIGAVPVAVPDGAYAAGADAQPQPAKKTAGFASFLARHLSFAVALAILSGTALYNTVLSYPLSPVKAVRQDIEQLLTSQKWMAAGGDPAAAAYYNNLAAARLAAWRGAALGQPDALKQAIRLAPSDGQVRLLSALSASSPGELETGFLTQPQSSAWQLALLDAYAAIPKPNAEQQARHRELLHQCIVQGMHLQTAILPDQFATRQNELLKTLDRLEASIAEGQHFAYIAALGAEGGITRARVEELLKAAEARPDSMALQYLAMSTGASFLYDSATHYARTGEAAIRYHDLFMAQTDAKTPTAEIVQTKQAIARALVSCKELQKCVDLLQKGTYEDETLETLQATSLFALKQYEPCLEACEKLLQKDDALPQVLYLAANSSLLLERREASFQYAIRLARIVEAAEDPLESEALLYAYILRCTLDEHQGRYYTEVFSSLSEEETALLRQNTFLWDYLSAAHLWSRQNRPEGTRAEALAQVEKVLKQRSDLSRAWYVKGALHHELGEDQQAEAALKKSLALDDEQATAWYALATLYDRTGDYEAAYAACQNVLLLLPASDHDFDVFGVSIHAEQLMGRLASRIKGGS